VLHQGRLRAEGTIEELMAETGTDRFEDAFLRLLSS
jgi:hypothetical protein